MNSVKAGATQIEVRISEQDIGIEFSISDNGCGMSKAQVAEIMAVTLSDGKVKGIGLPLLKRSVTECNGNLTIDSSVGQGTTISALFRHTSNRSEWFNDLSTTLMQIISGNPDIEVTLRLVGIDSELCISTSEFKSAADGIPISQPHVAKLIKEVLDQQINKIFAH